MASTNVYFTGSETDLTIIGYRHRWTDDHGTDHDPVSVHIGPVSLSMPPQLAARVIDALTEQLANGGES